MDINNILFLLVVLNVCAELWFKWQRPESLESTISYSSKALFGVLGSAVLAYFLWPEASGFIAIALWLGFLIIPSQIRYRKVQRLVKDLEPQSQARDLPIMTYILIGLNCFMFIVQVLSGSTQPLSGEISDSRLLIGLGGLYTPLLEFGGWWRILAAQFLHLGLLHLACNMIGLRVLGPQIEKALGSFRFLICYLIAGSSGMLLVSYLFLSGYTLNPSLLVGASAGVLGLVGVAAGLITKAYLKTRSPAVLTRLSIVGQILLMQLIFDMMIPAVSSTAHFGGVFAGMVLGLALRPKVTIN